MKLLITLDFPPARGGIQKYLCGIVHFCYNKEDAVFIAGMRYPAEVPLKVNARMRYFSSPLDVINRKISLLFVIIPYVRLCRRFHGSLSVECGNVYAALVPWLFSKITKQPYRVYTYGTELIGLQKRSLGSLILRSVLNKAEKIFTLGKYSEDSVKKLNITAPVDRVPPRIILPGVSGINRDQPKDHFTILCVGRLVKHKGHGVLIRAAQLLAQERKYHVVIIGEGPEYAGLQHRCASLGVGDMVSIKQNLSDEQVHKEFKNIGT